MLEAVFFRRPGLLAGSRTGTSLACEAITTSAVVPPARWTADRAVVVQLRGDRDLTVAEDDSRSSASPSTRHSRFACANDTVVITGERVADPGVTYAPERIG